MEQWNLPQLNIPKSEDFANALLVSEKLRGQKAQAEHYGLQNAILKRKMSPEVLAGENALAQMELNKKDAENKKANMEDVTKGLAWIKDSPEPDKAYINYKSVMTKEFADSGGKKGVHPLFLPDEDLFYTTARDEKLGKTVTKWDHGMFEQYANSGQLAMKQQLRPEEGKTYDLISKNPKYGQQDEAGNLISPDESKYVKLHMVTKNGQPSVLGTSVVESPLAEDKAKTFSEPYPGKGGTLLQKDLKTGQIRAVVGREPRQVDETGMAIKNEKLVNTYHSQAYQQAMKETQLKYPKDIQFEIGPDGSFKMSSNTSQAAANYFIDRVGSLKNEKVNAAVKRGALPKDYAVEPAAAAPVATKTNRALPTF
jgi:hypothetical protein